MLSIPPADALTTGEFKGAERALLIKIPSTPKKAAVLAIVPRLAGSSTDLQNHCRFRRGFIFL